MDVTRETLVDFLAKHMGKMKKSDFVSEFKSHLESDDPSVKRRRRDDFKTLVNQVAYVKDQDGVRYVVLKSVHRPLLDSKTAEEERNMEVAERGASGGGQQQKNQELQSNSRFRAGGAVPPAGTPEKLATEALSPVHQTPQKNIFGEFKVRRTLNFDVQKHSVQSCVLSEPNDLLSLKSSERACLVGIPPDRNKDTSGSPKSPKLISRCSSSKTRPLPAPIMSTRRAPFYQPCIENRVLSMVPLEDVEHQWLIKCAAGHWNHVLGLLMQDSQIVTKRDFTSGFTVLHWAAKCGNTSMLVAIMDIVQRAGVDVDVNAKSNGGYTPLHVAALHGQDYILTILVGEYGANVYARDNSGRRAYHYLWSGAVASVRKMLGQPMDPRPERILPQQQREEHELKTPGPSRGRVHSISRLFQSNTGKLERKHKQRPLISSSTFISHSEDTALFPTEEEPHC